MPAKNTVDLINQRYGVKTHFIPNPLVSAVGVTAVQILGNNPRRLAWVFCNLSPNNIYLAFDNGVSATRGLWLAPSGGMISATLEDDFELVCYEVWAVASGANSSIYGGEVVIS